MNEEPNRAQIDQEVRKLLQERIESFEQLEALRLLHQHLDRSWSTVEIAEYLNISDAAAGVALKHLRRKGLVDAREERGAATFKYAPEDPDLSHAVELLSRIYEGSRVEIMKIMSTNAVERLRTQAQRLFADAFLLRRKKDG